MPDKGEGRQEMSANGDNGEASEKTPAELEAARRAEAEQRLKEQAKALYSGSLESFEKDWDQLRAGIEASRIASQLNSVPDIYRGF